MFALLGFSFSFVRGGACALPSSLSFANSGLAGDRWIDRLSQCLAVCPLFRLYLLVILFACVNFVSYRIFRLLAYSPVTAGGAPGAFSLGGTWLGPRKSVASFYARSTSHASGNAEAAVSPTDMAHGAHEAADGSSVGAPSIPELGPSNHLTVGALEERDLDEEEQGGDGETKATRGYTFNPFEPLIWKSHWNIAEGLQRQRSSSSRRWSSPKRVRRAAPPRRHRAPPRLARARQG
jgi:hypothetical protein